MPPRKEPKETVTYPPSKRKPPPFKPQRPSQAPRVTSTNSEPASRPLSRTPSTNVAGTSKANGNGVKRTTPGFAPVGSGMFGRVATAGAKRKGIVIEDDDDDEDEIEDASNKLKTSDKDQSDISDDDLADDPLTARPRKPPPPKAPAKRKPGRPPARKEASPVAISDDDDNLLEDPMSPNGTLGAPVPSQSGDVPSIPRALLLRLMHEHFASNETKIDKHALAVLEKYFEIYIREAIARSLLAKKEEVETGAASQSEERWLEKSDLEKIVAGVVMDF
ncbi:hypothetical protein Q7P35_001752 [Cladosporium inversicolor]